LKELLEVLYMQFSAKARFIHCSPYKLRPLVSAIRGKNVTYALNVLETTPVKKAIPIKKLIASAAANARSSKNVEAADLVIKDIRVDEGPIFRYFKPGAMGRSTIQRRRFSHMSVILESVEDKKD
jgi:large subunit ribosomal protein L22